MPQMRQNVAGTQNKFTGVFSKSYSVLTAGTVVFASDWSAVTPSSFFAEEGGSDGQRVASADLICDGMSSIKALPDGAHAVKQEQYPSRFWVEGRR